MALLDWLAFVFGVLGVIFTIRQNIICWPISLIGVGLSFVAFYQQRLFGDAALQIIFFIYGLYGWYNWLKLKPSEFKISVVSPKNITILMVITLVLFLGIYKLLIVFKGDKVLVDAILTALSLTTTYMMIKKWIENWLIWVVIDLAYMGLYISKNMYLFALLYFIFALVAFAGFFQWKKELKK